MIDPPNVNLRALGEPSAGAPSLHGGETKRNHGVCMEEWSRTERTTLVAIEKEDKNREARSSEPDGHVVSTTL